MASPHAAGLAALLVSALAQEKHPIDARAIKQALMVTARPLHGATFLDEGTGLPEIETAYRWLLGARPVADIQARALGQQGNTTAAIHEVGEPGAHSVSSRRKTLPVPQPTSSTR